MIGQKKTGRARGGGKFENPVCQPCSIHDSNCSHCSQIVAPPFSDFAAPRIVLVASKVDRQCIAEVRTAQPERAESVCGVRAARHTPRQCHRHRILQSPFAFFSCPDAHRSHWPHAVRCSRDQMRAARGAHCRHCRQVSYPLPYRANMTTIIVS